MYSLPALPTVVLHQTLMIQSSTLVRQAVHQEASWWGQVIHFLNLSLGRKPSVHTATSAPSGGPDRRVKSW